MLCTYVFCLILVVAVWCQESEPTADDLYQKMATLEAKVVLSDVVQMALLEARSNFKSVQTKMDEMGEDRAALTFALANLMWHNRTDGQESLNNSTCDILMAEYEYDDWETIDGPTRMFVRECAQDRMLIDFLRLSNPELSWLPQDLLTNPWRRYVFGADLIKSLLVYWQHWRDQCVPLETWRNATYAHHWEQMTLSVAHYTGVDTQTALDAFRLRHSLDDYMRWNKAGQHDAVLWLVRALDKLRAEVFTRNDVDALVKAGEIMARVFLKNDE